MRTVDEVEQFAAALEWGSAHLFKKGVDVVWLDGVLLAKIDDFANLLFLRVKTLQTFRCGQSKLFGIRREANVGIVLAQQYAVFGSRGKHTIGLVHAFCHKVVDEHANIRLVAVEHEWLASGALECGIDTRHQALARRLLISGGAVYLSCEEQAADSLSLERVVQLCGVEKVVFDGIARTVHHNVAEARYALKSLNLHIHRQTRRKAIQVKLVSFHSLGFKKQRVVVTVGEGYKLSFDARAVTRTDTLDLAIVEWGVGQSRTQHLVHLGVGVGSPARQLRQRAHRTDVRKAVVIRLARLHSHFVEMHRTFVNAHRRSRLHACRANAQAVNTFGQESRSRFGASSAAHLFATNVHQAAQKSARRNHHGTCHERGSPNGAHTFHHALLGNHLRHLVLPNVQVRRVFKAVSPFSNKACAVALCPWAPHGGAFRAVKHAELDSRGISHLTHLSAERINLAYNLSFGNTAHGRVAAHLRYFVHVHCHQARFGPHACSGTCRLATGMACTDNNDVVVKYSFHVL